MEAKGASRQDVYCITKSDKHGTLPDELRLKFIPNDDSKPSDKEQLPKSVRQPARDDLREGIMILPSSHS